MQDILRNGSQQPILQKCKLQSLGCISQQISLMPETHAIYLTLCCDLPTDSFESKIELQTKHLS